MLALLKSEMKYFRFPLLVMIILPLIFTAFALSDIKTFPQVYFLKKYFWSALVGLGIYGLVFMIWSMRKKEMRERKHALTPIAVNRISFMRWLFGISPFVLVGLYIELLHGVLPFEQLIFIDRINGQLGMMFIALVAVDLVMNSWIALESKRYDKRLIYSFLLVVALATFSFGIIYSVTTSLIKPLGFGGEEIIFFIWAIIISIIDTIVFTKRKSFLG
jgi:hypothetical protein